MSDLEYIIFLGSPVLGAYLWNRWYRVMLSSKLTRLRPNPAQSWALLLPIVSAGLVWGVLINFAASDVRTSVGYLMLYLFLGIAWVGTCEWLLHWMGISAIGDLADRQNVAVFPMLVGAIIGLTFCYSGGNIGEGPGTEVVFFSAGLATGLFFLVWWIFSAITEADYVVTIDRDMAAGLRVGGFLMAVGLILGRAAAGNWVSVEATVADMIQFGSPAFLLLIVAIIVEYTSRPTVNRPVLPPFLFGIVPMLAYLGAAIYYLMVGNFPV